MSTYNELATMVLDLAKVTSDDGYFTKEHIIMLLSKYRAFILNQQYSSLKKTVNDSNYQSICMQLAVDNPDLSFCGKMPMLRSVNKLPDTMNYGRKDVYPPAGFSYSNLIMTNYSRFKYLSNGSYQRNNIYVTIGPDKYIYVKSANDNFKYLHNLIYTGVFMDCTAASKLECDNSTENGISCSILDKTFPLEDNFQSAVIRMVLTDIMGGVYNSADTTNNAHDELSDFGALLQRYTTNAFKNRAKHKDDE